jgi:hypothetical protein
MAQESDAGDLDALIADYVAAAKVAAQVEDIPAQNQAADRLTEIDRLLSSMAALDALIPLLDDQEAAVRVWAAAHLLFHRPDLAFPVLASMVGEEGPAANTAQWTLRMWYSMELDLPREPDWRTRLRSPRWGRSLKRGRLPDLANTEMNPTSTRRAVLFWGFLAVATFVLLVAGYGIGLWS